MDNLETNDKMMEELGKLLAEREIPFEARQQRIMCIPHVINIVVQHVIGKLSSSLPPKGDDNKDNEGEVPANTKSDSADPISSCRKRSLPLEIRSSGQRREKFESWIKTGELSMPVIYIFY